MPTMVFGCERDVFRVPLHNMWEDPDGKIPEFKYAACRLAAVEKEEVTS